jgi:hypothetical protein
MAKKPAEKDRDRYCTPPLVKRRLLRQWREGADLDPCHDPTGLQMGRRGYDIRRGQDGLVLPWRGRVWLNPPYSNPGPWLKLAALYRRYRIAEVTAIVNVQSGSNYWRDYVWGAATAICFLHGRVAFMYDGIPEHGNRYDQAVLYYGDNVAEFYRAWGDMGAIVRPARRWLTAESRRSTLGRMMDEHDNQAPVDEQPDLMKVLAAPLLFTVYSRVKHMTVEEVIDGMLPYAEEFIAGFQLGRMAAEQVEDEEMAGVSFDPPEPPPDAESRPTRKRKRKASTKKKPKAAKKKAARKTKPKPASANGRDGASGPATSTAHLDDHVLTLLRAKGAWTQSRDLASFVKGVNDNRLRKSLARLEKQGLVVSQGRTKSKTYMATPASAG